MELRSFNTEIIQRLLNGTYAELNFTKKFLQREGYSSLVPISSIGYLLSTIFLIKSFIKQSMYLSITYLTNNFLQEPYTCNLCKNSYYFYPFDSVFLFKIVNYTK